MKRPDLTIIVCTRDRAESLRQTLRCLAQTDRAGMEIAVSIVDNGSGDHTRQVADEAAHALPVRYLHEPPGGIYGKSRALNRALGAGGLGELVAVLDDDISVESGWCRGVLALPRRRPDADFFTGCTTVIWPDGPLPPWARDPRIQGWLFSSCGCRSDRELAEGRWFPGGHFWFRARVLEDGRRFEDTWLTEPTYMLQLAVDGFRGVQGPDASAGHRIQPDLLDPVRALRRAQQTGRSFAAVRLNPRFKLRHSRLARQHPVLARLYVGAQWLRWRALAKIRARGAADSVAFGRRLAAVEREANFREAWRILRRGLRDR